MKQTKAWPPQPFIGVALAAVIGIVLADYVPSPSAGAVVVIAAAGFALLRRSTAATYLFVAGCFFFVHSLQQTSSPGVRLARELEPERQAVIARGTVATEPRVSGKGTASFLLRLDSIEHAGQQHRSHATISVNWR